MSRRCQINDEYANMSGAMNYIQNVLRFKSFKKMVKFIWECSGISLNGSKFQCKILDALRDVNFCFNFFLFLAFGEIFFFLKYSESLLYKQGKVR